MVTIDRIRVTGVYICARWYELNQIAWYDDDDGLIRTVCCLFVVCSQSIGRYHIYIYIWQERDVVCSIGRSEKFFSAKGKSQRTVPREKNELLRFPFLDDKRLFRARLFIYI